LWEGEEDGVGVGQGVDGVLEMRRGLESCGGGGGGEEGGGECEEVGGGGRGGLLIAGYGGCPAAAARGILIASDGDCPAAARGRH
jgi:hypothetical protein